MNILVLNAGSSTFKFQLIATDLDRIQDDRDERLCRGAVDHIGPAAEFSVHANGASHTEKESIPDIHSAIEKVLHWIVAPDSGVREIRSLADIHGVGHRVVHGGDLFSESAIITDRVLQGIRDCSDLAPLHNPKNIEGIEAARKFFGSEAPQVAVFDTAFHHTLPERAYLYALPYRLFEKHRIRRYGFHGTSHRYVAGRYRARRCLTPHETNIISLHLGNGCSACAIKAGISIDTSMGLTPTEGLVMGTRSGDIDPGMLSVIAEKDRRSLENVESLLNNDSGLLGLSGISSDMRELEQQSTRNNRQARLAIDVFCYRARKYIGAYLAALGGADAVVFTGGIGENSSQVRQQICDGLQWAGLTLDPARNANALGSEACISTDQSTLAAFCIPTDEELLIARDTLRCILGAPSPR